MKKLALALMALGACSAPPAADEARGDDQDREMLGIVAILGRGFDPALVKVGQWASYRIAREGDPESRDTRLQVVSAGPDGTFWVEQRIPLRPFPMVTKARMDRAGKLVEEWAGGPGSNRPTQTYPFPGGAAVDKPKTPPGAKASTTVTEERITAGGRSYLCKKVTTTIAYPDGRTTSMTLWCNPEVPFSPRIDRESPGGIVRYAYGRWTLELADFGWSGAQSELEIPKR